MAFSDSIKAVADKLTTQAKERHVQLTITAGKQNLNMGPFATTVVMRENEDGKIYFDRVNGFFEIVDYSWEGAKYKNYTTAGAQTEYSGKAQAKHKGGLGGAVVGTLLCPGIGTAIGYAMTRKTVASQKGNVNTNVVVQDHSIEASSQAKLTLKNIETGDSFAISFPCNTTLDAEISNFPMQRRAATAKEMEQQKSSIKLLKEYKQLLDENVISQEEFEAKKRELLGM